MITFKQLDDALDERSKEWDSDVTKGLLFRALELGGEAGELQEAILNDLAASLEIGVAAGNAMNIAKKLVREEQGLVGSTATLEALADELGDLVISAARVAKAKGIDLGFATARKFNKSTDKYGLKARIILP